MPIAEQINKDIIASMKAKEPDRLSALRMIKTALTLRQSELPEPITDPESVKVLQKLLNQRRDAADQFRAAGRPDRAAKEESEAELILTYLPLAPTTEEISAAIEAAIAESGAASPKDMGNVIKLVRQKLAGKTINGKALSDLVKTRLGR